MDDEKVLAAHIFLDLDEYLLVGEAPDGAFGEGDFEIGGDRLGKRPIGIPGDQLHGLARSHGRRREGRLYPARDRLDAAAL